MLFEFENLYFTISFCFLLTNFQKTFIVSFHNLLDIKKKSSFFLLRIKTPLVNIWMKSLRKFYFCKKPIRYVYKKIVSFTNKECTYSEHYFCLCTIYQFFQKFLFVFSEKIKLIPLSLIIPKIPMEIFEFGTVILILRLLRFLQFFFFRYHVP